MVGAAMVAIMLALTQCTSSAPQRRDASSSGSSLASTSAGPSRPADGALVEGGAPLSGKPCQVALPATWKQAISAHQLWSNKAELTPNDPMSDGSGVLTQRRTRTSVQVFVAGRDGTPVGHVLSFPATSANTGIVWTAVTDRYAAWTWNTGADGTSWSMYLWDRTKSSASVVGHSEPAAGSNFFLRPVLTDDALFWVQPTTGQRSARIWRHSLSDGSNHLLANGLFDSLTEFDGQLLTVRAKSVRAAGIPDQYDLVAIDPSTGTVSAAPAGITAARDLEGWWLAGDGVLVWGGTPQGGNTDAVIRAWRPGWPTSRTVYDGTAEERFADHEQFAGPLLTFHDGTRAFAYDTRTDSYTQLDTYGGDAWGHGNWLTVTTNLAPPPKGVKISPPQAVSLVDATALPPLPRCPGR